MEQVKIEILFFGALKTFFGNNIVMNVSKGSSINDIIKYLQNKDAGANGVLNSCQVAVNSELEREGFIIERSCQLAILPPFSGG